MKSKFLIIAKIERREMEEEQTKNTDLMKQNEMINCYNRNMFNKEKKCFLYSLNLRCKEIIFELFMTRVLDISR